MWSAVASCSSVSLPSTSTERPFSSSTVRDALPGSEPTDAEASLDAAAEEGRAYPSGHRQASAAAAARTAVDARGLLIRGEWVREGLGGGVWPIGLMLSSFWSCLPSPQRAAVRLCEWGLDERSSRRASWRAWDTARMIDLGAVLTAIVTPFDAEENVNAEAFVVLMRHLAENGSDGFVVAGT